MSFPRILLVTPAAAAFPCAGGEVLRKICRALPVGHVYRASLRSYGTAGADESVHERFFPLSHQHWRWASTFLGRVMVATVGAREQAAQIGDWAAELGIDKVWVLAEHQAVSVAWYLGRTRRLPMHLTFHDAPEVSGKDFGGYTDSFMLIYMRRVRRLLGFASSFDAVSAELVAHVKAIGGQTVPGENMVFAPSMSNDSLRKVSKPRCYDGTSVLRRIGLCGSLRESSAQWQAFLTLLGSLPFHFEIIVYADPDYFPEDCVLPRNLTVSIERFLPTEIDVIRSFLERQVHACYLGLWKEKQRALFCRTSLSSKLSTYAAAGLPVIVDGPELSAAWTLVRRYEAGVLLNGGNKGEDREQLKVLFGQDLDWTRRADGSARLGRQAFNFELQAGRFAEMLNHDS